MTIERYLAKRHFWEAGIFLMIIGVSFVANVGIEMIDRSRDGLSPDIAEAVILEATSHLAMALAIPLLLVFDRTVPIQAANWALSIAIHFGASVVFSFIHVVIMYWARVAVFSTSTSGGSYYWSNWPVQFGYEYLKDFRTYFLIIVLLYLYRFIIRRMQGEAGFLSNEQDTPAATELPDKFLVKKLGREFLVRINDIEWIESCGNYVNLHVGGKAYPLRETMTRISERLSPLGFLRVHRRAIVNLDWVVEISHFDSGDGQATLRSNATVPVSRRFRQELRQRFS